MSDLISRQAAIERIDEALSRVIKGPCGEKILARVPSAQPEQRWIPCSERLPEKPNVYTVTDSNDRVVRFVFTGTDSSREYWKRCAKAWMPLPEPYKEDDHETD